MTVHAPVTMTKEAFLDWVGQREERCEFSGGRVTMMVRVTRNHARVTKNLQGALDRRLPSESYDVLSEAFAVHVGDSVRFPDVLVEAAQPDGKSLRAESPILIAEVLSPGTYHLDFGDKLREYLTLPSLDTYLIISPDEPRIWVWQRTDGAFPKEPRVIEKRDEQLGLPALTIDIPLEEIYRGIT
jgi:Uma2 family endonuclease